MNLSSILLLKWSEYKSEKIVTFCVLCDVIVYTYAKPNRVQALKFYVWKCDYILLYYFSTNWSNFPFSLVNQLIRLSYPQKFYTKEDDKKYFEGLAFWSGLQLWSTIDQIQFSCCKNVGFCRYAKETITIYLVVFL